jgi:uncharacterized ion transporter superfamily protein YfcC
MADRAESLLERMKKVEMPHPLVILFAIVVLAAAATYVLPGGEYQRIEKDGRKVAVAGSYRSVPHRPQGLPELALVPFNGMMEAAEILVLIFIIGGAFNIIKDTGALSAGISRAAGSLKGREAFLIPVLMSLFGLAGGIFGMYEEVLPFVGVVVPMAVAIGYDSITGVCIVYLGTVLGFCGAFFNPFTVGIAQGVAGLPLFSGLGYRLIVWTAMVGTGIVYTMIYAARVRKDPRSSAVYESDDAIRKSYREAGDGGGFALDGRRKAILLVLAAGFAALPFGVISRHWGIKELSGLFFALGILSGAMGGKGMNAAVESFVAGARDMMGAALLIGVARGIKIMLENGLVMDTILCALASTVSLFPKLIAVQIMFFTQCFMNLFIQSGSAQAAVSMPIMAPLADLLGISRQTAVLAFQLGDGFTNFAIPWNGITLAVLNIAAVPIWAWFRWAWRLQAWLVLVCMALLVWPTLAHWGPF